MSRRFMFLPPNAALTGGEAVRLNSLLGDD